MDIRIDRQKAHDCGKEAGRGVKVLEGHPTLVVNAAWTKDQRQVISCDEEAEVRIWSWDPGSQLPRG